MRQTRLGECDGRDDGGTRVVDYSIPRIHESRSRLREPVGGAPCDARAVADTVDLLENLEGTLRSVPREAAEVEPTKVNPPDACPAVV